MRSAFFISLLLVTMSIPRRASASTTTTDSIKLHGLSTNREWLRLLHLEKSGSGYRTLVHTMLGKPSFFLTGERGDGKVDPSAELQATFQQMFADEDESAQAQVQCRFLARRDFILRHWQEISSSQGAPVAPAKISACPEQEAWLQRLGFESVSLIFASAYMNSAPSSFGHTFFKIHNAGNDHGKDLLDYGINFAARTSDTRGALYALYGLFGYFPGTYSMMPYYQMIKEYTHLEGRDLWEYELNLTPQETKRMIWHLLELEGTYFDYYFSNRNCSWAILRAIEAARPDLDLTTSQDIDVIPLDSLKLVERTPGLVKAIRYRPSLESHWQMRERALAPQERNKLEKMFTEASHGQLPEMDNASVKTLDAAADLFTLKSYENHQKFDGPMFAVLKERAQRNQASPPLPETVKQPPSHSPDSSTVQIGWNEVNNSQQTLSEGWLGLRFLFHDLLSPDQGASPWSHLEFLSARLHREAHGSVSLGRYRLLEILSTQASAEWSSPWSWELSVGGDRELNSPERVHMHGLAGAGFSFDFFSGHLRWINLAEGGGRQSLQGQAAFTLGLRSLAVLKIENFLRAEIAFADQHLSVDERRHELITQAAFIPWPQWELRLGQKKEDVWQGLQRQSASENSIWLEHHWIF